MNAVNPIQSSIAPGDRPSAAEPSMEEILASIRRIIADDQSFSGHPQEEPPAPGENAATASGQSVREDEAMHVLRPTSPPHEAPSEAPTAGDVVEPDHGVHTPQFPFPEGPSPEFPQADPRAGPGLLPDDLEAALATAIPPRLEPDESLVAPPPGEAQVSPDTLFSPAIDTTVTTAFNTLAASRLVASSDELKGLVREMIRPLLKTWVEENLPQVVERLVVAEIERIARGRP